MTDKLSIKREESPIISGIEELLYAITGQPAFCASTTGIPNPSYAEGYNKQKALLYNIFSCILEIFPTYLYLLPNYSSK